MKQYHALLQELLEKGEPSSDRTGTGTLRKAGHMLRFNLQDGFPLVTTKKVHIKSVIHELLWFLSGDTNIKYLVSNGVSIWTDWPLKNYNQTYKDAQLTAAEFEERIRSDVSFAQAWGELGPVYGKQWVDWEGIEEELDAESEQQYRCVPVNQIQNAMNLLKSVPDDRGIVITAWNPADINKVALRWCHCLFQLIVIDGKLNLEVYQRSCDSFLGLPFNIASYALLCHMFAQQAELKVGDLIWVGGDVHLYNNHIEQAQLQLSRQPVALPRLQFARKPETIFDYRYEDFEIVGYAPHPAIKAEVSV